MKPFYVKATPDAEFDPTAHIQIDYEEMEYQNRLIPSKKIESVNQKPSNKQKSKTRWFHW